MTGRDARGTILWGRVIAAVLVAALAVGVCGGLGWWQWSRASTTGRTVQPDPAVALAEVLSPAQSAGEAIGRQVTVTGTWADVDAAVVTGREVDGTAAEMLVRALTVPAEQTGTGEEATLAVVVGWRADGEPAGPDDAAGTEVALEGYLRAPEASTASSAPESAPADGTFWASAMATSELAQVWPAPMYSALLVSYDGTETWTALEPLPPTTELNFRSAAYALEWWLFGAFALFITMRWIRDNGRARPDTRDDAQITGEDHA
ncbi:SURF1 family cytochrome oxidase biogenesis protein [Demequina mangrovi]|uniref:SURF1-like protein n=1 Tax=Demequina mangrovi TaxID=1043493 RepID=A0A1H6WU68_9MICO|nr:SURF1 family cytochrome oxidase biogenesis protein [Demequina mangrovi]SEJ17797.1 Cytochrome oxidase assembly protein ShyY1 [Demequina mangrovi]